MVRLIKKIVKYIVCMLKTIISLLRIIRHSKSVKLPLNQNKKILILGNGPSMKNQLEKHLEFFLNQDVLGVNSMAKTQYYKMIKPKHYMLWDPVGCVVPKEKLSEEYAMIQETQIEALVSNTEWEMNLFLPYQSKTNEDITKRLKSNKNINIVYLNNIEFEGIHKLKYFCWKKCLAGPSAVNILIMALYLAINLKYKEIYLFGAEHTWFKNLEVSDENILYLEDEHYYDKQGESVKRVLYGSENGDYGKEYQKMPNLFWLYFLGFREYHKIQEYSKIMGANIYNATPKSFIDAFLKVKLFKE